MKRYLSILFVALLPLVASAHDFEVDGIYYNITSNTEAEVTFKGSSYDQYSNEYSGSITIPATVTHEDVNYSVTSIGEWAFSYCSSLKAITIPEGMTSIGDDAFYNCSGLESITLSKSVTSIRKWAFHGCSSLKAITLPEGMTSIGECVFYKCSGLESITIPESMTSIGRYAFYNCSSLKAITIPESMTSIEEGVFDGCSALTSVTLPKGVTSIGKDAFSGCKSLTKISIPEGVTSIGDYSFSACSSLTAMTLPESMTSIGKYAFHGCSSLKAINIPESVTSIEEYTFQNCSSLTAMTLPEGVTSIGKSAFSFCSSLTAINIPKGVTSIGDEAFYVCRNLKAITIPEGVTCIGRSTFAHCGSLTAITIPEGVTSIGEHAFHGCSLKAITIPEGVTSIGDSAFSGCSFTEITCKAVTPPTLGGSSAFYGVDKSIPVYVPKVSVEAYKAATYWKEFSNIVRMDKPITDIILSNTWEKLLLGASLTLTATVEPNNATDKSITWSSSDPSIASVDENGKVTAITYGTAFITATANDGDGASAQCQVIVDSTTIVTIDNIVYNLTDEPNEAEVTYRGNSDDNYFKGYTDSITIPDTVTYRGVTYRVTSIHGKAFRNSPKLKAVTIPEGVTRIEEYTFYECRNLTYISIPESVTSIGEYAFHECSSLKAITLPKNITSIEEHTLYFCQSLTEITIPEGVTSIGESAFGACRGITEIVIPENVTSIGSGAFGGCFNLKSINIPQGVTRIEYATFGQCYSLTEIVIPEGVTSIGNEAFSNCSSLTEIVIPENVTSIGYRAFYNCSGLTEIVIPENSQLTSIGSRAFEGCSGLTEITIPKNVKNMILNAFENCSGLKAMVVAEGNTIFDSRNNCNAIIETKTNTLISGCASTIIPESVTSIGSRAFGGCNGLTEITIPESVTIIGYEAFSSCSSLITITIPENSQLTRIVESAFSGCSSLESITIPQGVTSIEEYAFMGCSSLKTITCKAVTPPTIENEYTFSEVDKSIPVYVPEGSIETYKATTYWREFTNFMSIVPINRITLSQASATLTEGETLTLTATIAPDDAYDKSITWSSSDPCVATVDSTGKVIAIAPGTATITATANDGSGVNASCEMIVVAKSYVLTFLVDDEVVYTDSVARGAAIVVPEVPEKEGYTFSGWGEVPSVMPAHDVTIQGAFIINTYHVTFKIGDEVIAADSLEYGAAIVVPEAPEKEGHTFSGWGEVPSVMPAHDVTYEGCYIANVYKVYYYVGTMLVNVVDVTYGEAIPEYIYVPEEGDIFLGWIGDTYETMPAHDVTYTANIESGIDQSTVDNDQLIIYDLNGRRVTDMENLRGGIYIVNGRKVVIK